MKRVLIIHYTQSGQLTRILERVAHGMKDEQLELTWYRITPEPAFPFPWDKRDFFDTFPETHSQEPCGLDLGDMSALQQRYDLIILGYQVWFLTPSQPVNSFMMHPAVRELFHTTPVITLVACRNMWIMAQEKLKARLNAVNAKHVGHIAMVDRHINHISVITIAHWMFSGKKSRYLGIFPKPGVSEKDIDEAIRFGAPIKQAVLHSGLHDLQNQLLALGAVRIKALLLVMDRRGDAIFSKWSAFLKSRGPKGSRSRSAWAQVFRYYLHAAIWLLAPVVILLFMLTYPLTESKLRRDKEHYATVPSLPND